MSWILRTDYEMYGDKPPAYNVPQQASGDAYYVFSQQGQPVGVVPVSQGGVSGALGLPSMQYSEPRLNLQGLTLFQKVEQEPVSPYAGFGEKTFGDFPNPTVTPTASQLNAYKFAYTQGAGGAVAPATPYPISSHLIAATKGTPASGVGEFSAGLVGSAESFWNPQVPSVWNVAYEKVGWQPGTYTQDIMRQYPGYAAGSVVGEFAMFGVPTGKGLPKLLSKAGARVDAYLGLKAYPELRLGNMVRSYKDTQVVTRAIRGMEGGTIRTSETFAPRVAKGWFTEGEFKGFMEGVDDVPKVRVESTPKSSAIFVEQGQRAKTVQLLELERPTQRFAQESAEMPGVFPKLLSPSQYKRMLMAEEYGLDFYTMPLPKQVMKPPVVSSKEVSKMWSGSQPKLGEIGAQTDFMKQAVAAESSLIPSYRQRVSPFTVGRSKESEISGIYSLPGVSEMSASKVAQSFRLDTAVRQRMGTTALPSMKYKMQLPRRLRISDDDEWLPKAKRRGGSYEERINPFNENFIRDLRKVKL